MTIRKQVKGRVRGRFTNSICKLEVGQSLNTTKYARPTVQSFAWRAGDVIFKGERKFSTSMNGKKVQVTRTA